MNVRDWAFNIKVGALQSLTHSQDGDEIRTKSYTYFSSPEDWAQFLFNAGVPQQYQYPVWR